MGSALTLSLFVSDSSREGVLDELREGQSESVLIEEGAEPEAEAEAESADVSTDAVDAEQEEATPAAAEDADEEQTGGAQTPD